MLLPVTYDAASEISHDTASAISLAGRGPLVTGRPGLRHASKYSSNSCGCGRSRIGSISLERL